MSDPETVTGAPGFVQTMPGEDEHDLSAAGAAPGADELDAAIDPDAPALESIDNSGDSMGDDDVPDETERTDDTTTGGELSGPDDVA